jgi:hypothetical protein
VIVTSVFRVNQCLPVGGVGISKGEIMNRYSITFMAKCPNNDRIIRFALSIESKATIMVEDILKAVDELPATGFHEDIADALTVAVPGRQTLCAHHHGVDIETVRGAV